jgi:hypothetical protein
MIQTSSDHPEESIQHSEYGKSLTTRALITDVKTLLGWANIVDSGHLEYRD